MKNEEIKAFFKNINSLKLSQQERKRMMNLFQVRGTNKVNKVMSFKDFKTNLKDKNGKIQKLVLGPKWNRLVFVDINVDL